MSIIDITDDLYSDVTYTRTITARQLVEIPSNEIVALKVLDRDDPSHTVWVRIDGVFTYRDDHNRLDLMCVNYNDGYETDQYFYPSQMIEIAMVG